MLDFMRLRYPCQRPGTGSAPLLGAKWDNQPACEANGKQAYDMTTTPILRGRAPFSVLNSVRKNPRWKPRGASSASSAAQASTVSHRTSTSSSTYMKAVWSPTRAAGCIAGT